MTTIEKEIRVPHCRKHRTEMKSSEVWRLDPASNEPKRTFSFCCAEVGCNWTYSPSSGYYRFREGEPVESEEPLHDRCPLHRHRLSNSEYDRQSKIEVWRCPEPGCETVKNSRME